MTTAIAHRPRSFNLRTPATIFASVILSVAVLLFATAGSNSSDSPSARISETEATVASEIPDPAPTVEAPALTVEAAPAPVTDPVVAAANPTPSAPQSASKSAAPQAAVAAPVDPTDAVQPAAVESSGPPTTVIESPDLGETPPNNGPTVEGAEPVHSNTPPTPEG